MKAVIFALLVAATAIPGARAEPKPLTNTHSHNDYEQKRPLDEALDQGFCSVEADIYLIDGQLLIGHNRSDVRPGKTLQSMYLDPLRKRIRERGGVYPGNPYFIQLIDVKTEAGPTYRALAKVLEDYREILSTFTESGCRTNLVTVIITGNRDIPAMAAQKSRLAAVDGRLADLAGNPPASLIPQVSESWTDHFHWLGGSPMPPGEREKLDQIVATVHSQHRALRFWATRDRPDVWKVLLDAHVDLIGADHLKQLRDFLVKQ